MTVAFPISSPILRGLTQKEIAELERIAEPQEFEAGMDIVKEGETTNDLFVIQEGEVQVLKAEKQGEEQQDFSIAKLKTGDIFGEIAFVDHLPRSSTVQAITPTKILRLSRKKIHETSETLCRKILNNISDVSFERIRKFNTQFTEDLEEQVELLKNRRNFGYFFVIVIFILSITDVLTQLAANFNLDVDSRWFSWTMLLSLTLPFGYLIKKFRYPWSYFGVTLRDWKMSLIEGFAFGVLAVVVFLSGYALYLHYALGQSLITNVMNNPPRNFHWVYLYPVHAYIQEFVARGMFQSSLRRFLYDKKGMLSVFLASLIFAVKHIQIGLPLVIVTFIASMFLGWVYLRRENLLEVATIHTISGIVALLLLRDEG